jgi:hypothetical protein
LYGATFNQSSAGVGRVVDLYQDAEKVRQRKNRIP